MITDLRFAFRQLLKSPAFTLLGVVTLTIGIGLNTAIFSLIDDLFLRALPYAEQNRVVHLYANEKDRDLNEMPLSAPRCMHFREAQTIFSDFAGENFSAFTLTGLGDPVQVFGGRLTWNYFRLLGVVPIRGRNFRQEEEEFYRPWAQDNFPFAMIAVRSELEPDAVTRLVQSGLSAVDPGIAVAQPQTMETVVAQTLGQARLMMRLLGIFAAVAMALATVGVYGAVAYTVGQRTGEIGVRMAFGAETRDILRLVIRQGMRPVMAGLAVGLAATLALGRVIASQLYQTSAYNPLVLAATLSALGLAAFVACVVPARRASLVNPIDALRVQ